MNKNATLEKEPETMDNLKCGEAFSNAYGPVSKASKSDKNLRKSEYSHVWIFGKAKCSNIFVNLPKLHENVCTSNGEFLKPIKTIGYKEQNL